MVGKGEKIELHTHLGNARLGEVLSTFYGDKKFPVNWGDKPLYPWLFDSVEEEKKIFWYRSDAHYPLIFTPLHEDIHTCWDQAKLTNPGRTSIWMYDRYWFPTGLVWLVRREGARLYQGVVPPPDEEVEHRQKFFDTMVPVYADKAVEIWDRLREKSIGNLDYLDSIDYEKIPLPELLLVFQDALDFYEEHFRDHWYVNLSYYLMLGIFEKKWKEILGEKSFDPAVFADLSISVADANWRRLRKMYELKETIKKSPALRDAMKSTVDGKELLEKLEETNVGKKFLEDARGFLKEYGWTCPYVHQLQVETWYENPAYFLDQLRFYYDTNFDWNKEHADSVARNNKAKKAFEKIVESAKLSKEKREEVISWYRRAVKMAPINPDHHFYYDQGTQTRVGFIIRQIGKKLAKKGLLRDYMDVFYLHYDELRTICTDPKAFDSKKIARERREKLEKEYKETPYIMWFGTATEWALDKEFWRAYWGWDRARLERADELREIIEGTKAPPRIIKGMATATPVGEGIARVVISPEDFDKVKEGDVAIAIMTSPAWASLFPRLGGLVTDSGSPTAHPAIVSRIWNVPCVVGAEIATGAIKDGQRVKVNGMDGTVEIME